MRTPRVDTAPPRGREIATADRPMVAAWVASLRPDNILFMVGLAFSIAASAFFPALVLGIFWKRANKWGR